MPLQKQILGDGPWGAKLWIIGECPGQEEELAGSPKIGATGRYLKNKLKLAGLNPEDIRFENLIEYRPPQNRFDFFEADPVWKLKLEQSIAELVQRVKQHKPNLVFLMGAKALYYLYGQKDISAWRGHLFYSDKLECKIICSYAPVTALRQQHVHKLQKPGQYDALFSWDVKKAVAEAKYPEIRAPDYQLLVAPTFEQVILELDYLLEESSLLSFDIETSGLAMTCIGFANSDTRACCIPLLSMQGDTLVNHWEPEEFEEVYSRIVRLLKSDIPKVAQNSQFDMAVLEGVYKLKVNNLVWDTMVAAHNIYCDLPKDLGTLMSLYTNMPYHKFKIRGSQVEFWEYNALDAIVTYQIMQAQIAEMKELGILNHYRNITNPLIYPLVQMQITGVKVDDELRTKALAREERIIEELKATFCAMHPTMAEFKAGSSQKVMDLFYNRLGCKPIRVKGALTANADALAQIEDTDNRRVVALLCEAITRYRTAVHMRGVLNTPLKDGRMNTAYSASGTDTGRLNSKESIFDTGTNLQNLQVGVPRQMLVPG